MEQEIECVNQNHSRALFPSQFDPKTQHHFIVLLDILHVSEYVDKQKRTCPSVKGDKRGASPFPNHQSRPDIISRGNIKPIHLHTVLVIIQISITKSGCSKRNSRRSWNIIDKWVDIVWLSPYPNESQTRASSLPVYDNGGILINS